MSRARFSAALTGCLVLAAVTAACGSGAEGAQKAAAARGHDLIVREGCGTCHTIGGVERAEGDVGPKLVNFRAKRRIAGRLPNRPDAVVRWLLDPQAVKPDTRMPNLHLTPQQARDIAAYLYSQ